MLLWGTLVGDWETKQSAMLTVVRDDLLQERDDRRRAVLVWLGEVQVLQVPVDNSKRVQKRRVCCHVVII
jgi:hypothetical protein